MRPNGTITTQKPAAGAPMPVVKTAKVGGEELTIGPTNDWQMVVVYRGRHCPLCRRYLAELNRLLGEYHPDVSRRRRYEQT